MKFDFEGRVDDCTNTHHRINFFAFPEHQMHDIFAFQYSFPVVNFEQEYLENGWGLWNPDREFDVDQGINFDSPSCVS